MIFLSIKLKKKLKMIINKKTFSIFFILFFTNFTLACDPVLVKTYYKIIDGKIVYGEVWGDSPFEAVKEINANIKTFSPVLKNKENSYNAKEKYWFDDEYFSNDKGHYFTDKAHVFYKGTAIINDKNKEPLDIKTFKTFYRMPLNLALAKNYIYYDGVAVEENTGSKKIDIATLKMADQYLISDKNNLYHKGKYVGKNIDLKEIASRYKRGETTCENTYYNHISTNIDNVFVNGIPLNADPKTFAVKRWIVNKVITYTDKNGEYQYAFGHDSFQPKPDEKYFMENGFYENYDHLFIQSYNYELNTIIFTKIPNANPEKIKFISQKIAFDDRHIFIMNYENNNRRDVTMTIEPIHGQLTILENDLAKDDKNVYLFSHENFEILEGINPKKLEKLKTGVYYDGKNILSYDRNRNNNKPSLQLVNDLDESFRKINENFAVDKNRIYLLYKNKFEVYNDENASNSAQLLDENLLQTNHGFYSNDDYNSLHLPTIGKAKFLGNQYVADEQKVYQLFSSGFKEIKEVNAQSFVVINENFSKDKERVFYRGIAIYKADPATFEPTKYNFAKDKNAVFVDYRMIENTDKDSFEIIDEIYSKDKNKVYRYTEKVEGANPKNFQIIGESEIGKDDSHLFWNGEILQEADYKTFKVISYNLAKDKNHLYWENKIVNIDVKTFHDLGCNYVKDKNGIYFLKNNGLNNLENADPKTFKILGCDDDGYFAEDASNYYRYENLAKERNIPQKYINQASSK